MSGREDRFMNTFHLNPELRKIASHISVRIHGMPEKAIAFGNGQELVEYSFDKLYRVEKIRADESWIILELVENSLTPTNWNGEEQTSFF